MKGGEVIRIAFRLVIIVFCETFVIQGFALDSTIGELLESAVCNMVGTILFSDIHVAVLVFL